jgi:predicted branched-subunit amino acid permease
LVVGPIVPGSWRLEYAPPIMFVALVLIGIRRVPQAVAALVGGSVGLVTAGLPDRLGILAGSVAGVAAGTVAEYRSRPSMNAWSVTRDRRRGQRDHVRDAGSA